MRRPPRIEKLSDRFGDLVQVVMCRKCKHCRRSDPHALARILGWDAKLTKVAARMRCSNCGAKDCEITVESIPRRRGIPKNPY